MTRLHNLPAAIPGSLLKSVVVPSVAFHTTYVRLLDVGQNVSGSEGRTVEPHEVHTNEAHVSKSMNDSGSLVDAGGVVISSYNDDRAGALTAPNITMGL